jgi:hypothetical protein
MTRVPDALPGEGVAWAGELLEDLLKSMIFRRPPSAEWHSTWGAVGGT